MTALSSFSLPAGDSKVSEAVLQAEISARINSPFPCMVTWVGVRFGILGVFAIHKSSCKEMLSKLPFHVMQHLGNNENCPRMMLCQRLLLFSTQRILVEPGRMLLPAWYLRTGNIPSNSPSHSWNHSSEPLPSPRNENQSSKVFNTHYKPQDSKNWRPTNNSHMFPTREKVNPTLEG